MRKLIFVVALLVTLPLSAQTAATPASLWDDLMKGNARFAVGGNLVTNVGKAPYGDQWPEVTVLSCADSRVPPELIFNQGVGKLFVLRTAGNIPDPFAIASVEYAVVAAGHQPPAQWTKLIVVLGHQRCGAVAAALKPGPGGSPSLDMLVDRIRESFAGLKWNYNDPKAVDAAVRANARASAAYLLAHSAIIRNAVLQGKVGLAVAYYSLDTGKVERIPY